MSFSFTTVVFGGFILLCLAYLHRRLRKAFYLKVGLEYPKIINIAAESLNKKDENGAVMTSRLAGLYALAHVAEVNPVYHDVIMQLLCTYIRTNSPKTDENNKKDAKDDTAPLRHDIVIAINIIKNQSGNRFSRLIKWMEKTSFFCTINLENCDLHGAKFGKGGLLMDKGAHLPYTGFNGADLTNAEFNGINLTGSWINDANMTNAQLREADLTNATLCHTNLTGAYIRSTNLTNADFYGADMMNAETLAAFAHGGFLSECKNLTQEQINKMFCGHHVEIPEGLNRPEHWPKTDLSKTEFMTKYKKWLRKTYPHIA